MSSLFKELKEGLEEALGHARGEPTPGTREMKRTLHAPTPRSPASIKRLRVSLGKTQDVFAQLLGVSKKTVESWEAGTKKPNGSVLRLFQIMERDVALLEEVSSSNDIAS